MKLKKMVEKKQFLVLENKMELFKIINYYLLIFCFSCVIKKDKQQVRVDFWKDTEYLVKDYDQLAVIFNTGFGEFTKIKFYLNGKIQRNVNCFTDYTVGLSYFYEDKSKECLFYIPHMYFLNNNIIRLETEFSYIEFEVSDEIKDYSELIISKQDNIWSANFENSGRSLEFE